MEGQTDKQKSTSLMPDVSSETKAEHSLQLERVGMSGIEMPIIWGAKRSQIPAKIDAYVSLDNQQAKGIHMSRLYLNLKQVLEKEAVSLRTVKHLLQEFVSSQKGLSRNSYVQIQFLMPVERKALVSDELGWRQYPVVFKGQMTEGALNFEVGFQVTYSSTCPCSAALAKQLIINQFTLEYAGEEVLKASEVKDWLEKNALMATPHAQRSYGDIIVRLDSNSIAPEPLELIDLVEKSLATPVQAAVKRQDEQEFALRNGQNLMFCEDAARRVSQALDREPRVIDYALRVDHQESLHPHSAVSETTKGIPGGLSLQDIPKMFTV